MEKWWIESKLGHNNSVELGMSSGLGCEVSDLPTDIPPGSTAFDYTTKTLYTYDGVKWN